MAQTAAFLESPPSAPNLHADFFSPSQLEEMGGREWVGLGDGMEYNAESRQPTAEDHANQPKTKTSSRCMCNDYGWIWNQPVLFTEVHEGRLHLLSLQNRNLCVRILHALSYLNQL